MLNHGAERAKRVVFFSAFAQTWPIQRAGGRLPNGAGTRLGPACLPHRPLSLPLLQSSENSPLGNFLKGFIDVPSCHVGECPHHVPVVAAGARRDGVHPVLKLSAVS